MYTKEQINQAAALLETEKFEYFAGVALLKELGLVGNKNPKKDDAIALLMEVLATEQVEVAEETKSINYDDYKVREIKEDKAILEYIANGDWNHCIEVAVTALPEQLPPKPVVNSESVIIYTTASAKHDYPEAVISRELTGKATAHNQKIWCLQLKADMANDQIDAYKSKCHDVYTQLEYQAAESMLSDYVDLVQGVIEADKKCGEKKVVTKRAPALQWDEADNATVELIQSLAKNRCERAKHILALVKKYGAKQTAVAVGLSVSKITREFKSREIYEASSAIASYVDQGSISWAFVHDQLATKKLSIAEYEQIAQQKAQGKKLAA